MTLQERIASRLCTWENGEANRCGSTCRICLARANELIGMVRSADTAVGMDDTAATASHRRTIMPWLDGQHPTTAKPRPSLLEQREREGRDVA